MCGIFAWIGHPDPSVVESIVTLASSRGPHSHGYTVLENGIFHTIRGEGDATHALALLQESSSEACIGHSRLATTGWDGDRFSLQDTMPFTVGHCSVVHNGNINEYETLAKKYGYDLLTNCDSEIIAHLYDALSKRQPDRRDTLNDVMNIVGTARPYVVVVLDRYGRLSMRRKNLPLYVQGIGDCVYCCSRSFADAIPIPEETTVHAGELLGGWKWMISLTTNVQTLSA